MEGHRKNNSSMYYQKINISTDSKDRTIKSCLEVGPMLDLTFGRYLAIIVEEVVKPLKEHFFGEILQMFRWNYLAVAIFVITINAIMAPDVFDAPTNQSELNQLKILFQKLQLSNCYWVLLPVNELYLWLCLGRVVM